MYFIHNDILNKVQKTCLHLCMCAQLLQSCPILCDPVDYSPPGSSVHGVSQARILEWVAISFSRGFSEPRDWTRVSCIAGRFLYCLSHQGVATRLKSGAPESSVMMEPFCTLSVVVVTWSHTWQNCMVIKTLGAKQYFIYCEYIYV